MRQSLPKPEATSPTWPLAVLFGLRLAKSNASARVLLAEGEPGGRTTPGNVTCGLRQFLSAASAPVCCFLLITTCCQGRARGEGRGGTAKKAHGDWSPCHPPPVCCRVPLLQTPTRDVLQWTPRLCPRCLERMVWECCREGAARSPPGPRPAGRVPLAAPVLLPPRASAADLLLGVLRAHFWCSFSSVLVDHEHLGFRVLFLPDSSHCPQGGPCQGRETQEPWRSL